MLYPKIGIRPVIDGRWGGVRESLENQTMRIMAINGESRQTALGVCCQNRSQIHRAGALGAIEAPDCLNGVGVHVERLGAVAPAGGHRQRCRNILGRELLCHAGRLGTSANRRTADHALHRRTIGVLEVLRNQFACALPVVLLPQAG